MSMPRTVEEILAHADELAQRFENYEPSPDDELDPAVVALLRAAVAERSAAEKHLLEAVQEARNAGLSWSAIGGFVGTTNAAPTRSMSSTWTKTDAESSEARSLSSRWTKTGQGDPPRTTRPTCAQADPANRSGAALRRLDAPLA